MLLFPGMPACPVADPAPGVAGSDSRIFLPRRLHCASRAPEDQDQAFGWLAPRSPLAKQRLTRFDQAMSLATMTIVHARLRNHVCWVGVTSMGLNLASPNRSPLLPAFPCPAMLVPLWKPGTPRRTRASRRAGAAFSQFLMPGAPDLEVGRGCALYLCYEEGGFHVDSGFIGLTMAVPYISHQAIRIG